MGAFSKRWYQGVVAWAPDSLEDAFRLGKLLQGLLDILWV